MKRFTFSLAAVLKQREALLDQAQRRLGERMTAQATLEAQIREEEAALEVDDAPQPGALFDPRFAALRGNHRQALREALQRRRGELEALEKEVEAARVAVAEAHQAVEVMERLKEKARAAWALEVRQAEQKESDEQSSNRRR